MTSNIYRILTCHIATAMKPLLSPFQFPTHYYTNQRNRTDRGDMSSSINVLLEGGEKVQFYTPKTYGIPGTKVKGFHVDDILLPGSRFDVADIQLSTWYLLKFHILRALLSVIFYALELYRFLPIFSKQGVAIHLGASEYNNFDEVFKEMIGRKSNAMAEGTIVPQHVGAVLKHFPKVSDPRAEPQRAEDLLYYERESRRLVSYVIELICWAVSREIPTLSIYEQTGFLLEQNMENILSRCSQVMGHSGVSIKIHARSANSSTSFLTQTPSLSGRYELNVYVFQRNDAKKSLLQAAQKICQGVDEGQLASGSVARESIDELMRKSEIGIDKPLDLIILTGPNGACEGFPIYAAGNTVV
ncbi:hypothetical protein TRVA0_096S00188 [Trichomonascus vanleenenianus]|uniref:uncharacterized protein n=1 Tax=Trichomonascus vanleenenianus TaxID=2268995 RepID=UPI003ECB67AB